MHHKTLWPVTKKGNRGFRGYPVATVAFYGSDDRRASLEFVVQHGAKTVAVADRIIGCPHEEGIDYPDGQKCPRCPFWSTRDRWSGDVLH